MTTQARSIRNENLYLLDNLSDYKVHHDDVDPRGYTVTSERGEVLGEVTGLLADREAKRVRYLEVEVADEVTSRYRADRYTAEERHALIPVGLVHIDTSQTAVKISGLSADQFVNYPRFDREDDYTTSYEIDTNEYLATNHEFGGTYDHSRYNTSEFRNSSRLDADFYDNDFYTPRRP
jgi:hypothetical protein